MVQEGELLKQVVRKQAIVYKVTEVQRTAVRVEELCIIGAGKMTISQTPTGKTSGLII